MKKGKTKQRATLLVAVATLFTFAVTPVFAGGAGEADDQVTIRIAEHPGPHVQPMEEYFIPRYEELTGVNIEMEVLPPDQLWQRMSLEAQSGSNYYDIGYHSPGWFGYYYESVANLRPYMEANNFDLSQYSAAVQESHMTNELLRPGEIIALARNPQTPIYAYRTDWFSHTGEQADFRSEYGYDLAPPETWEQLYDIAEFFTRPAGATVADETLDEDLYGYSASISAPGGMARAFLAVVYSMGLNGFDENYETDLDNPMLLEGVAYWERLVENTFPPAAATWNFLEHLDYFRSGRLASAELWPEGVMTAEDPDGEAVGNVGYATLPRWEGNLADLPIGRSFLGGGGVLMFDTPRSEEAFKFLQWVYEENAVEFTKRTAMFARDDQFENEEVLASADFYETFLPAFGEQMAYGFPRQDIAEWGAVMYTPVGEFAADVISGVMTPEAAQQRLVDNMNTVFREEGYIE